MTHWLLLLGIFGSLTLASSKKHTAADLETLGRKQSWGDILQHANDVAPAERDAKWNNLVEKAAIFAMEHEDPNAPRNDRFLKKLTTDFPILKKSPAFMAKRAEVGMGVFERCFEQGFQAHECAQRLIQFVRVDPTNADLAFKAGKLLALKFSAGEAMAVFPQAMTDRNQGIICADETVQRAILGALAVPEGDLLKSAQKMADGPCFKEMKEKIAEELGKSTDTFYLKNACVFLKAHNALSEARALQCEKVLRS